MNKHWLVVVVATVFEVMWVTGLKYADNWIEWGVTAIAIIISFGGLIFSAQKLPTSTVYAVFVGLGTVGTIVTEMVLFDVPFRLGKLVLIGSLLIGIIGLKLVTDNSEDDQKRGEIS